MKSPSELRMHCITLANALACGKSIKPEEVVNQAQQYLDWIEERHVAADLEPLRRKYGTR